MTGGKKGADMESNTLLELAAKMVALLQEIAENTKPEYIDEKITPVKGFKAGDPQ